MTARPSCHGPCLQGHVDCPVPDACEISDAEYDFAIWRGLALGVAIVAACAIVLSSSGGATKAAASGYHSALRRCE